MTGFEGWMRSAPLGKEREISRHEIVKDDPCLQRLQASTALTLRESQPTVENPIGWSCHLQFGHLYKRSMTLPYQWLFLQFFCRFEVSTAPTWLKMDGQLCNKPGCTNALPLQSAILYYYRQTTSYTVYHRTCQVTTSVCLGQGFCTPNVGFHSHLLSKNLSAFRALGRWTRQLCDHWTVILPGAVRLGVWLPEPCTTECHRWNLQTSTAGTFIWNLTFIHDSSWFTEGAAEQQMRLFAILITIPRV